MTVARARCQASNRELQRARDRAQQLADEANERHQRRMDQQRKLLEIAKSVQAKGKQYSQWIDTASRKTQGRGLIRWSLNQMRFRCRCPV